MALPFGTFKAVVPYSRVRAHIGLLRAVGELRIWFLDGEDGSFSGIALENRSVFESRD
jgi:hypothetical protein